MKTLVIIPAYNEENSLHKVIGGVRTHLPEADVLVVDDGSTDRTAQVAINEGGILLKNPYNMGIGATMQTGFLFAYQKGYEIVIQVNGDGQHNPKYLPFIIEPIKNKESNLVIGSRYLIREGYQSTWLRKIGIKFFVILLRIFTGNRITDPTSGFRAMDRRVLEEFSKEYPSDYPEVEAILLLHKRGLRVKEIPVTMRERSGGVSSIGIFSAGYYMMKVTLSLLIHLLRK
ncbi:MAG: glycosyltransferase family 2 protein [Thermodesulfobacteriota bacterium]